jgi:PAS domain S-box-containing protein
MTVDVDEGKKAEEQSGFVAQLQATLNVIPAYAWYAASSGGLTFVNKRTADYLGLPEDHPLRFGIDIGAQWDAHIPLLHPDDHEETRKVWSTCLRSGEAGEVSFRVRNAQGGYRWFLSCVEPLRASDGSLLLWVGVNLDIEELKCAEQALREREAKIRRLVDSNIIGIFITGLEGRVLEANDAFLHLVGHDRDDLVSGRIRWTDLTPPEWRERDRRALAELRSNTVAQPYEKEFFRKDGSRVPVLIGGALFEEGGNEGVAFVLDLTERKRAEEALREREAKIQRLVDSNIIGIFIWDFDGRVLEANDEFLRMVGYDREDLVAGRIRWAHLTPPDWRDRNNARIEQQKGGGRFEPFEKEYTRKDGSRVPVLIGGATFEVGGNQGVAFVLDLTERKGVEAEGRESERRFRKAQLELEHANRVATMGQLTASITHEVNQPITAAVTYALAARRFLSAEPPNFREVDDALSLIVREGNRAGEVVGRIRALIKKAPARKDAVEINDAILEVIALTHTEAANNSISVRTQLAEALPRVQGDRVQLQQVLLNLIINAIEAMRDVGEEERELLISTRNEPDGVSVEVRDSGPGFAPAVLDRVFEAFYTTKPGGLGLGLSICRSIIEAHNGRLWASPNVPRGAIFGLIAPAHPAAAS